MDYFNDIKKNKRSFFIAAIINVGAILSGFDAGGIGAIVSLPRYLVSLSAPKLSC